MTTRQVLKLGTRRSLLAWAQSSAVARQIEKLNPGISVELVGIDTRGDKIQDVPLRAVEGKEFFVAELDEALSSGAVDISVHSMKDLSLERPRQFVLAAIPPRENSRDAVLFGPGVIEKLKAGEALRIGTSSPRRLENIPAFLKKALPSFGRGEPRVEFVEIRGNVNTRLSRVHEPAGSDRHLDAVVLAFAGLNRLWADDAGRAELQRLLKGVRWMVLPLRESPPAAAQGALAVECRGDDAFAREVLGRLHDRATEVNVRVERGLLAEWGGGCHQRFGSACVQHPELGQLFFVRGVKPDGEFVEELRWKAPVAPTGTFVGWNGSEWRSNGTSVEIPVSVSALAPCVFVAHSRAVHGELVRALGERRVWVSGSSSWFKLASLGVWVEGSAESLGFEFVAPTFEAGVLQLPRDWVMLTHADAPEERGVRRVASYRVGTDGYGAEAIRALGAATDIFWSSGSQFKALSGSARADARHYCGPGRTVRTLRESGVRFEVFPSSEEWSQWLKQK